MTAQQHLSRWPYIVGYILAVGLTFAAFWIAGQHEASRHQLVPHAILILSFVGLAIIQLFVQLIFFLHLGREVKPRFRAISLTVAGLVVVIIVGGSLWIMKNLDYNMMNTTNSMQYMHDHEGI